MSIKEIPYSQFNILKYKSSSNLLRHARCDDNCDGVMLVSGKLLVGYIGWQNNMIIALEVSSLFRNKGYGEYLLKKAIDNGCSLLTVNKKNENAIRLYKRMGFKEVNDYGKVILMQLK